MRNAMAPSVVVIAQVAAYLVAGIIITENVFNYPGVGRLLVDAVKNRDVGARAGDRDDPRDVYVLLNIARRPGGRVPDPEAADGAVVTWRPRLAAPRAHRPRARSAWCCSPRSCSSRLLGPLVAPHDPAQPIGLPGETPRGGRAARHRRARARRAQPRAARRA